MSTRATIKFTDECGDSFYVYRGHDGFPDIILPDIKTTIDKATGRWGGSGIGQLLSLFFGEAYRGKSRIQEYELTTDFHGDESYRYFVDFVDKEWIVSVA